MTINYDTVFNQMRVALLCSWAKQGMIVSMQRNDLYPYLDDRPQQVPYVRIQLVDVDPVTREVYYRYLSGTDQETVQIISFETIQDITNPARPV